MMVLGSRNPTIASIYHRRKPPTDLSSHSVISGPMRALELAFQQADARKTEIYRRGLLPAHPTLIEHGPLRILISSTPTPHNLHTYADTLRHYNVKHVVRVCEPFYSPHHLHDLGFELHEAPFGDGDAPPAHIVSQWLSILDCVFDLHAHAGTVRSAFSSDLSSVPVPAPSSPLPAPLPTVAVHCVAGLGRAPVLAAIALVELGLDPFEAVGWIRALRRGAINAAQMAFLENYTPRPPPTPPKPLRTRSRSASFVGALWPTFKTPRPFRPRSPTRQASSGSTQSSPSPASRRPPASPPRLLRLSDM